MSTIPALARSPSSHFPWPPPMNLFRSRAHHLIDRLSDADLASLWDFLETFYHDVYMLRAIQNTKQTLQPGDALTRDEALELLPIIQSSPRYL